MMVEGQARPAACHALQAVGGSPLEARAGDGPAAAGVRLNLHICRQINRSDEVGARSRERLENAKKQATDAGVHAWQYRVWVRAEQEGQRPGSQCAPRDPAARCLCLRFCLGASGMVERNANWAVSRFAPVALVSRSYHGHVACDLVQSRSASRRVWLAVSGCCIRVCRVSRSALSFAPHPTCCALTPTASTDTGAGVECI